MTSEDKASPEWRAACEAREVAAMTKPSRDAYYALVLKHRGKEATNALLDAVNRIRRRLR